MEAMGAGLSLKRIVLPLFFLVASGCGGGSGGDQVSVPALAGLPESAAFNKLTAAGLTPNPTEQFSTTVPNNAVISQSPAAGTSVPKGTQVSFVSSIGPPITVPNIVGETQAAASANCTAAQLDFNVSSTQFSSTIAAGLLISQSPSAGSVVSVGTGVVGVVSLGPAIAVPNVVGNTQAAALTAITGAGLADGTITPGFSATIPVGSVISESPSSGTDVASATAVNLVISSYTPVPVPNVAGQSRTAATAAFAVAGLTVGEVMLVQSGTLPVGEVASENPAAGTGVQSGSTVNLTISAGPALAETVLYSFIGGAKGTGPGDLLQGSDGNFYGVTGADAAGQGGSLFKLTPSGVESVVYIFGSHANDGFNPDSLIQGADGSFYGTTFGGFGSANGGTVYRISPAGSEAVLYSFQGYVNPNDGIAPLNLVQGGDGNFYGAASCAEVMDTCVNGGIFFKVTQQGAETVLHTFGSIDSDGTQPGAVLLAKDGNFYGTTSAGGTHGHGTVFRMTPAGAETVLYSFGASAADGVAPYGLIQGSDGNFYGATASGGQFASGSFFKVTPTGAETILYSFHGSSTSSAPLSIGTIVQGSDGNFYGTASAGGEYGQGAVFSIDATGAETIVYSFSGCTTNTDSSPSMVCGISGSVDGAGPGSIIQASDRNFYGTTVAGGASQSGTVFRITGIPATQ